MHTCILYGYGIYDFLLCHCLCFMIFNELDLRSCSAKQCIFAKAEIRRGVRRKKGETYDTRFCVIEMQKSGFSHRLHCIYSMR